MLNLLRIILFFGWGLWIGGLAALLVLVLALFGQDRSVGALVAPLLFRTFLNYSFILALVCTAASAGLLVVLWNRFALLLLVVFGLSLVQVGFSGFLIHRMDHLRAQGHSQREEFQALHRLASLPYLLQIGLLAPAGVMLNLIPRKRNDQTAHAIDPGKAPPA